MITRVSVGLPTCIISLLFMPKSHKFRFRFTCYTSHSNKLLSLDCDSLSLISMLLIEAGQKGLRIRKCFLTLNIDFFAMNCSYPKGTQLEFNSINEYLKWEWTVLLALPEDEYHLLVNMVMNQINAVKL